MDHVISEGLSAEYGVRPLRRVSRGRSERGTAILYATESPPSSLDASSIPHPHPPTPPPPTHQSITACIDDVLADAVLHGRVAKGGVAHLDIDPATGLPACWAGRSAPADLLCPPVPPKADSPVGGDGDDGMALVTLGGMAGGFGGGGFGDFGEGGDGGAGVGAGEGGGAEVLVLASGGFEDEE
jgi:hypothetical protein